ncbi:MAG: glycosyltransferase family 2 protein [Verrucomicrobia bacterium]|nr:glycosyltransferase family 2 protein [Verrucomicrobiota bacterium]
MKLSVVICTHNPRPAFLSRTLDALREQTLPLSEWELLIVDNLSDPPASTLASLDWHPDGHHLREEVLGLTPARLLGIRKSRGELIVFVDDDNILDKDYLANALNIYHEYPFLGAFGASIDAEFEVDPPASIRPYLENLAIRPATRDYWSNIKRWSEATPFGAGLCIRREVADLYAERVQGAGLRFSLDRRGVVGLNGGGDIDMAWTSVSLNKGMGCFARLHLLHLIPKERLTEAYIERLEMGSGYTETILEHEHAEHPNAHVLQTHRRTFWNTAIYWGRYLRSSPLGRRLMKARRAGNKAAHEAVVKVSCIQAAGKPVKQTGHDTGSRTEAQPVSFKGA